MRRFRPITEEGILREQERQKAIETEVESRREIFEKEHEELLMWLRCKTYGEPDTFPFIVKMTEQANTFARFSEAQLASLRNMYDREKQDKLGRDLSNHVGSIDTIIERDVTVERANTYNRPSFRNPGENQLVHVIKMRDENMNAIVSMSPTFNMQVGKKLRIQAVVKKHEVYKDEKQTKVNRVKILKEYTTDNN